MTSQEGSNALLTSSTLSNLDASASLLEELDVDVVEEIIERAPRSATSFPLVYRAYCQVLEEHGLSSTNDERYYNFLLKLGVIRAPTWGERWDVFKASRPAPISGTRILPVTTPVKYRYNGGHTFGSTQKAIASTISPRKNKKRAGITFLAGASSDLDEGFEPSVADMDVASILGLNGPSSRKGSFGRNTSRSLVGYTPEPSVDYDNAELNLPVRTSTPVYAQDRHRHEQDDDGSPRGTRRSSLELPPYSVSDISHHLDTLSIDTDETFTHRHESPQTRTAQQIKMYNDWDDETEREMEKRADEFYRLGLAGRCWDVWYQSYHWLQSTTDQIDKVRSKILLRSTLAKWRSACEHQLSLPGTADDHRRLHLQLAALKRWSNALRVKRLDMKATQWAQERRGTELKNAWRKWRLNLVERRTERWKREVSRKEKHYMRERSERLLSEYFLIWYEKMRDRVQGEHADQLYTHNTQRKVLNEWMKRTILLRSLNSFVQNQVQQDQSVVLDIWRRKTAINTAERIVMHRMEGKLLRKTWEAWSLAQQRSLQASRFNKTRTMRLALSIWIKKKRDLLHMYRQAAIAHDLVVKKETFHVWMTKERGVLFNRVLQVRLLEKTVWDWRRRLGRLFDLKDVASEQAEAFSSKSLHKHFSRWRARLGDKNQKTIQAILYHQASQNRLVASSFTSWQEALDRIKDNQKTAIKARAFFAQRQALRAWRLKLRLKAQANWLEQRRLEDTSAYFQVWRDRLKQSLEDTDKINRFKESTRKRTLTIVLDKWTARVVEIKSREHDVYKKRQIELKRNALYKWRNASKRVKALQGLGQSFAQVRTEDHLKRVLLFWRHHAIRMRDLRIQSERSIIERRDQLLVDTFIRWRDKFAESSLREVELEVAARHEDALMFSVWDAWKARSTRLPEIAFKKRRILKNAWSKWRDAMTDKEKERSISVPRDQELLLDVFAVWKEHTRKKVLQSAIRRRGRVRPGDTVRKVSAPESSRLISEEHTRFSPTLNSPGRLVVVAGPERHARPRSGLIADPKRETNRNPPPGSVSSEPAYSRLRSELYGRKRGGSEESEDRGRTSELVKQLRGALK